MAQEYILDMGEDSQVIIVSAEPPVRGGRVDQAGIKDGVKTVYDEVFVKPLRGIAKAFIKSIPPPDGELFELDQFSVEFNVGLGTEAGIDNPIVTAKLMPTGNFKCTYEWKRKKDDEKTDG